MKCIYCGELMEKGCIQTGDLLTSITKADEIVVWFPEGQEKKLLPKDTVHLKVNTNEAYYCKLCKKAIGIFEERGNTFWQ